MFQLYGEGRFGEVFIEDQRPDGSVILLVCTEQVARRQAPNSRTSGTSAPRDLAMAGVATSSSTDGGAFPMLREQGLVQKRLPRVHVDTTNLPGGVLPFDVDTFAKKALDTAESGVREVVLSTETAEQWGLTSVEVATGSPVPPLVPAPPVQARQAPQKG